MDWAKRAWPKLSSGRNYLLSDIQSLWTKDGKHRASLKLWDGEPRVGLGLMGNEPGLGLVDKNGKTRAAFATKDGNPGLVRS